MNWQDLAGPLIKLGAPTIGTALGGPLGGIIGQTIGCILGGALGVPPTPDAVDEALKKTPPDELAKRLDQAESSASSEIARAEAEAQAKSLVEAQLTARSEMTAGDAVQRWWRPIYALELTAECAAVWLVVIGDVLFGEAKIAGLLAQNSGLLMTYWAARFGVLGVYTAGRTIEKKAELDQLAPSVIEQIVKAVRKR